MYNTQDELIEIIIGRAIEVHKTLGAGLSVQAYKEAFSYELQEAGLSVQLDSQMPISYKGVELNAMCLIPVLVEGKIPINIEIADEVKDSHYAQMSSLLRVGDYHIGFIMNFRASLMKNGIKRVINKYRE